MVRRDFFELCQKLRLIILMIMIAMYSPLVGQFFDTMIVASSDRVVIMTHQNVSAGNCYQPP